MKVYLAPQSCAKQIESVCKRMRDARPGQILMLDSFEMAVWRKVIEIEIPDRAEAEDGASE